MSATERYLLERDGLVVDGPDAFSYLQGQLSQDLTGLAPGDSTWSWVLAPAGKVDALLRVQRVEEDRFVLDTDPGFGDALCERLARFRLRTRVELSPALRPVLALRGAAVEVAAGDPTLATLWRGAPASDLAVEAGRPETDQAGADRDGAGQLEAAGGWEAARITAGVPVMGAELTERTIPAETGLVEATVSFTKGCYTGQELVARIDSRGGHVPRHLRLLRSARPLEVGTELVDAGKVVATVTSSASSGEASAVALAYVARSVEVGRHLDVDGVEVVVEQLPPLQPGTTCHRGSDRTG